MSEEREVRIESLGPIEEPPRPGFDPAQLTAVPNVLIPCPGTQQGDCDSEQLLTKEHALWVVECLEPAGDKRTLDQENNYGCALAWIDEVDEAQRAFLRVAREGSQQQQARAAVNLQVLKGGREAT